MPNFATRLRHLRQRHGLAVQDLALACQISQQDQLAYEAGTLKPNAGYLHALAAVGLEVAYLTTGEFAAPIPEGMDRQTHALLDNFKHSSREAQLNVVVSLMIAAAPNRARQAQEAAQQRLERGREAAND